MTDFFDSEADFQVYRRKLPHWRQAGVTYFVTFRLADSLPTQKLATLKEEKKRWLALNPPPHKESQIKEYHRNFSQPIHEWLDAGHGSCILAQPDVFPASRKRFCDSSTDSGISSAIIFAFRTLSIEFTLLI